MPDRGKTSFAAKLGRITLPGAIISLGAIALAWASFADASIAVARQSAPAYVLGAFPDDPFLAPAASQAAILQGQGATDIREKAAETARASIRSHSLNPAALRLLAYSAEDDDPSAERAIDLSIKMSRRDELAQLFKALKSAQREEMSEAYGHFDTAISTTRSARPLIFPVLVNALKNEDFRSGFDQILSRHPEWLSEFLHHLARETPDPTVGARLLIGTRTNLKGEVFNQQRADLIARLVDANEIGLARDLVKRVDNFDERLFTSAEFSKAAFDARNGAFGWRVINGSAIGAAPIVGQNGRLKLQLFATSGEKDVVATKVLFLNPGAYALVTRISSLSIPDGGSIQIGVDCFVSNEWAEIGKQRLTAGNNENAITLPLAVPGGCTAQRIVIALAGGSGFDELTSTIDGIAIVKRG